MPFKIVLLFLFFAFGSIAHPKELVSNDCKCKGKYLSGRVRIVQRDEDIRVRVVSRDEDIRVRVVTGKNPNGCGEWRFVERDEDIRVRYVERDEDIRVRFVEGRTPGI